MTALILFGSIFGWMMARLITHSVREQVEKLMRGLDAEGRKEVVSGLSSIL